MVIYSLAKILMVAAIAQPVPLCNSPASPTEIKNCKITQKGTKKSEVGKSCIIFKSGGILLERCDNTRCISRDSVAKQMKGEYCTTTQPSGPVIQSKRPITSRQIKEILLDLNKNFTASCEMSGLEALIAFSEELRNLKELKITEDTNDFKYFNESLSFYKEFNQCAQLNLSRNGLGPIIFYNKHGEKTLSLAFMIEREPYIPCFEDNDY